MAAHGASGDALDDGVLTTSGSDPMPSGGHVDPVDHAEATFITLAHKLKNSRQMMPPLRGGKREVFMFKYTLLCDDWVNDLITI